MQKLTFWKTGRKAEQEPEYKPAARGLYFVLEENPKKPELNEDEYMLLNLHAQKVLCSLSPEFEKAQKHWTTLPKNSDRQLGGYFVKVSKVERDGAAQEWIHEFDDYDGLVYVFAVTIDIDFATRDTWKPVPVVGISFYGKIDTLDDLGMEHRMRYRAYFVFAEK